MFVVIFQGPSFYPSSYPAMPEGEIVEHPVLHKMVLELASMLEVRTLFHEPGEIDWLKLYSKSLGIHIFHSHFLVAKLLTWVVSTVKDKLTLLNGKLSKLSLTFNMNAKLKALAGKRKCKRCREKEKEREREKERKRERKLARAREIERLRQLEKELLTDIQYQELDNGDAPRQDGIDWTCVGKLISW